MQLTPSLSVRQKQSLVMTPQLQQAIKLLQLTNVDLRQFLEEQALENPFIEVTSSPENAEETAGQVADAADALSDASGLTANGGDASTDGAGRDENPDLAADMQTGAALGDDPTGHSDLENRFGSDGLDFGSPTRASGDDFDVIANVASDRPESLIEFVLKQIDLTIFDPRQRFIAYELAMALEPSGWLGRQVQEIADNCGCACEDVEETLAIVQRLEPEGVFARDLAECLYIQIREKDALTPVMNVVLDNLALLGQGNIPALARKARAEASDIADCLRLIRECNPKPGEAFEMPPLHIGSPDVIVREGKDGWIVDLNRSTLPSLVINEGYAVSMTGTCKSKEQESAKTFANHAIGSAKWLRRALEQRNSTTLKISAEIVRRQADFLTHGLVALKPLALKDVAEAVGMHESTVSRVTSGLLMATPNGSFPMKSLFSVSIATTDDAESKAAAAVRNMIESIIAEEPAGRPLSDDAIAALVSKKGVKLARRTVAKYRDMLRIPSSSERRRRARLNMAG